MVERIWIGVLGFVVSLAVTATAVAQGTDGRLPDPINADDIARYSAILGLSEQQMAAVESFLEEYRSEFKLLRDGEIERALALEAREFAQRHPALLTRVAAADEELFRAVEPILSDEQLEALPYVRLVRERERYMAITTVRNLVGNALPDLIALVDQFDLPQQEREAVQAMKSGYQQRITSSLRSIFELSARLRTAPRGQEDTNDVERLVDRVKDVRRFNRQTARNIQRLITDEELALQFHRRFFRFAYAHAYQLSGAGLLPNYDALLRSPDLDERERQAILAMRLDAVNRQTRLLEEAADVIDESGIVFSTGEQAAMMETVFALHEAAKELRDSAAEALKNRVGRLPEAADSPSYSLSVSMTWHPGGLMTRSSTLTRAQPRAPQPAEPAPADQFLAPAITSEDVNRYARMLGIGIEDVARRATLESIHADYLEEYSARIRPMLVQLRDARQKAQEAADAAFDPDNGEEREDPTPLIHAEYELRERCLSALVQVDAAFFDAVEEFLGASDEPKTKNFERLRFDRTVQMYNRGQSRWRAFSASGPNQAAFVDITTLVDEHLASNLRAELAPMLATYRNELAAALRHRHGRLAERQKAATLLWSSPEMDVDEYIRRQQAVRQAHQAIARLNQGIVTEIIEEVGSNDGWPFLYAFQREAYPEAFNDFGAAEPYLAAAFELDDLRTHQRERLEEVATEYRPQYRGIREAIIGLCADFQPDLPGDMVYGEPDVDRAQREFNKELERLQFERENLNRAALRRIRAALDEAQYRRIGAP